jgi:hypothetical protein
VLAINVYSNVVNIFVLLLARKEFLAMFYSKIQERNRGREGRMERGWREEVRERRMEREDKTGKDRERR